MSNLLFVVYNLVYWLPIVLVIAGTIDYRTGFVAFALIVLVRAVLNFVRNNLLPLDQAVYFPLRSP